MCVTYCGSFPLLFDDIDAEIGADRAEGAETVGAETFANVSDHCWQCKLCYIKCPYTADEGAYELLDFPRLMLREKAQRARRDGVPVVDRVLGEPQLIGAAGSGPVAPLVNFVNKNRLVRRATETLTGIASEFPLPPLAREPFHAWFSRRKPAPEAGQAGQVVLFPTCYGDFNFPEVPRAAVGVLEKNGYSVIVPPGLTCCGMPNLDGGNIAAASEKMQQNVEILVEYARQGLPVVVPGPTCGMTMKKEWPLYVGTEAAAHVATSAQDLMQFLDGLRRQKQLNRDFVRGFGKVAYHAACHLRAQKVGIPGARLLGLLPDTEVRVIERCSAVDGTWGMKARFYEEGARYGRKLAQAVTNAHDEGDVLVVGDCNLAGLRIYKENGKQVVHPIVALAQAYGLDASAGEDHAVPDDARRVADRSGGVA